MRQQHFFKGSMQKLISNIVEYHVCSFCDKGCFEMDINTYLERKHLSRDKLFPTMWYFDMCRLRQAYEASF